MAPALKYVLAIVLCFAAAALGGFATSEGVTGWYLTLNKPSFNPPSWLFGPVWSVLYLLMGIALAMIWQQEPSMQRNRAMLVFGLQLVLNTLWSFLFFYGQSPGWALIEIVVLWLAILLTILLFWRIRPLAAYLLIPYLLWVSFATLLNAAIWQLN